MPKCINNTHTFYTFYINNHTKSEPSSYEEKVFQKLKVQPHKTSGRRMSTGMMTVTCLGMLLSLTLPYLRPQLLCYCN